MVEPPVKATKARMRDQVAVQRDGFEGGQMPLSRRLPKRGFRSKLCIDVVVLMSRN